MLKDHGHKDICAKTGECHLLKNVEKIMIDMSRKVKVFPIANAICRIQQQ